MRLNRKTIGVLPILCLVFLATLGPGIPAIAGGLAPLSMEEGSLSPTLDDLLGKSAHSSSGLNWGLFRALHEFSGSPRIEPANFQALSWDLLPLETPRVPTSSNVHLHVRASEALDTGVVPEFEVLVPKRFEDSHIATHLRLGMKKWSFAQGDALIKHGARYDTELHIERHQRHYQGHSRSSFSLHYTRYDFSGDSRAMERSVPVLEWDRGWRLETQWGEHVRQIVEPRLYYAFVPPVSQDELPNQDSQVRQFGFHQLFRASRFTGRDRIGDTNQASLGLSIRFVSADGNEEYLHAGVAQTVYFSPRQSLLGESTAMSKRGMSDLASVVRAQLGQTSLSSVMQWDPIERELATARAELRQAMGDQVLRVMHEKVGSLRFTQVAWDVRLSNRLVLSSRIAHNEVSGGLGSVEAGIQYDGCGWSVLMDTQGNWAGNRVGYNHGVHVLLVLDSAVEPVTARCRQD